MSDIISVSVPASLEKKYDVIVSDEDNFSSLAQFLKSNYPDKKIALVSDKNLKKAHLSSLNKALKNEGLSFSAYILDPGEKHKTLRNVEKIINYFLKQGYMRDSVFLALGGGVVCDMSGFAASIFARGVPAVYAPTTVLSQVDASVGGKTGVDSKEGKNLIGTFTQPRAVFASVNTLKSLPDDVYLYGFSEIVKHGIIKDENLFESLSQNVDKIKLRDSAYLREIVSKNVVIKKEIVEADEKEKGLRQCLNFGHTIGHSIEKAFNFKMSHGEAVAYGILYESIISMKLGYLKNEELNRIRKLMVMLGLVHEKSVTMAKEKIYKNTFRDKKNKGGVPHYVLIHRIGSVYEEQGIFSKPVDKDVIYRALDEDLI